jgi:hypothetical protein
MELKKVSSKDEVQSVEEVVITGSKMKSSDVQAARVNRKETLQLPEPVVQVVEGAAAAPEQQLLTRDTSNLRRSPAQTIPSETNAVSLASASATQAASANVTHITLFESEVEPMEFSRLSGGNWIFFRKVWRDDTRIIQGGLIDGDIFVERAFSEH